MRASWASSGGSKGKEKDAAKRSADAKCLWCCVLVLSVD